MNTETLFSKKEDFFNYLKKSGYCKSVLEINKNIINLFENFCFSNKIYKIESEVIKSFYSQKLNLENKKKSYQNI